MTMRTWCVTWIVCLVSAPAAVAGDVQPVSFNRDIRPILSNTCYRCHGFDSAARKANLRIDRFDDAIAPRENGVAIVPGDPAASLAIQRMRDTDPNRQMPPPESNLSVSDEQIALIERWIAEGAEYEAHWAYIAPTRPEIPGVSDADWTRNPIDNFIRARLDREGLTPSPEADRRELARRLSFDLTGLPPSYAEVEAFANDTEPDAYERYVDKLLASPQFGERMAVDWLDQVRYADTNGYHSDEHRSMWPYRDYVIQAFNDNMPFDQFTIEQLAGDLLPNATRDQIVASGYNRLNQITAEGGAQPKEYLHMYMADRVRAVGSVWLGTTFGCAECHDHKYDPFTMNDFYSLGSFFADVEERGVYPGGSLWEPILRLPDEQQENQLNELNEKIAALDKTLGTPTPERMEAQAAWEAALRDRAEKGADIWTPVTPAAVESEGGATMTIEESGAVLVSGDSPDSDVYTVTLTPGEGTISAIRLDAINHENYGRGPSGGNRNFVLTGFSVEAVNGDESYSADIDRAEATYEQDTYPIAHAIDKKRESGWAIDAHVEQKDASAGFIFANPISVAAGTQLKVRMRFESGHKHHTIDYFTLQLTDNETPAIDPRKAVPEPIWAIIETADADRTEKQRNELFAYYTSVDPAMAPTRNERAALDQQRTELTNSLPHTLITKAVEPRTIRVLPRGNFLDETGPVVTPAAPASLHTLPAAGDRRPTRLDLAQWIVDPKNPLTARVIVNRLWNLYYGEGLSNVLDDFGAQGEWPTHPELLDWLAVEFIESGWDVKHMVRLMVTSATYRQSSVATPDLRERDPYNRLYARQTSERLQAEFVRNNALKIAGILYKEIGGRSVYPYQPEGYWDDCNTFRGKLVYNTETDRNQYRRGLYVYWKRSFLHPSMMAFDAPNREECVAERAASNTPLQALVLLNDPTYVEAARAFAERIYRHGGSAIGDRIEWAYKQAVAREPEPREMALLRNLYQSNFARYANAPEAAKKKLTIGQFSPTEDIPHDELAAWTSVARAILNLHETITRI